MRVNGLLQILPTAQALQSWSRDATELCANADLEDSREPALKVQTTSLANDGMFQFGTTFAPVLH